jgi:hypothetical protein
VFEDGKRNVRAAFSFSSVDARTAQQTIEDQRRLIAVRQQIGTHERVLMRFTRTDIHDAGLNKRSGERVIIDSVSLHDLPVMYASEIAEREIRDQIRDADENVYKRGFVVDVVEQAVAGKTVAYAITAFHQVIDLAS